MKPRPLPSDVVAVVVRTDEYGPIRYDVEREITGEEADAINRGAIASPNLYLSLGAEAKRILVRVFEKPCCKRKLERSMMAEPNTK